jgi:hypothetical protein
LVQKVGQVNLATPFTGKSILGEDDYLAQTMGTQAAIRISDALAWLHPVRVFLAGMNEAQKSYIRAHMSDQKFIDVDGIEDIDQTLTFLSKNFDGVLACKASEIVQGLAMAKYENKRLLIDEAAPNLDDKYMHHGIGLVLIENNGTSDEVVAVNYAFSIGADIAFVSPIRGNDILPVQEFIYKWKTHKSDSAYQQLRETLIERTDGINFFDYEFTTFFTLGFPYGLLLNNMIPFTHVLIHPGCDLFILNNIGSELIPGVASVHWCFLRDFFNKRKPMT